MGMLRLRVFTWRRKINGEETVREIALGLILFLFPPLQMSGSPALIVACPDCLDSKEQKYRSHRLILHR